PRAKAPRAKPPRAAPPTTPPPSAILRPPSLGALLITTTIEDSDLFIPLARGDWNDRRHHELCLSAHRLSMVNSIDELLCLPTLHGVQELWYQTETVRKVLRRFRGRALLCDEVGLGKTIEAGMIIKEYILRGLVRSVLVLVPPSLVAQWREEMLVKFEVAFATTADPLQKRDPDAFWRESRLIIASLALARSQRNFPRLTARPFDLIVVDEAHHLKNRNTKAWRLLNSLKSRFLLLLTATPLQNNLEELHNLITLLKPGQLKTRAAFIREFVSTEDPTVPLNEQKLRELLSEVMVRNTRALAGLRLPPRHATTVTVEPAGFEQELYDRLSKLVRTNYRKAGAARGLNRLTLRMLQREAGSSPRALLKTLRKIAATRSPEDSLHAELQALAEIAQSMGSHTKLDALAEYLLSSRDKTIVFVSFRETLAFAAETLSRRGLKVILFHGGMAAREKEAAIDLFRNGGSTLLTTEVGGEGRNLQFCHRMVNFDLPWNPMRIEQRIGRIHRIGQEHEIEIVNFCAQGSVEDYLLEILDKKINLFELVIGEVDLILGQLEDRREFSERVLDAWASASSQEDAVKNFSRLSDDLGQAKTNYERIKSLDETLFGEDYEV
ncbi:MAG: DEAD/DEAH box helicase, partial [Candidatus Eisenbacteria sp.]|nr:DEAD/DEAH box helicase [Candidatus Eisenbacteria bacterium]